MREGSLCGLPVKSGEAAICCNFFNTVPDHYPPARQENSFPGRELAGTVPSPPKRSPPCGLRHFTSGAILDHLGF